MACRPTNHRTLAFRQIRTTTQVGMLLAVSVFAGCATEPATAIVSMLDEQTAVTISRVSEPLIMTANRPDLAANGRRYLHIGAAEVNTTGNFRYYLVVHDWATFARDNRAEPGALTLLIDGEPEVLQPLARGRRSAGVSEVVFKSPVRDALEVWYPVAGSALERLIAARQLTAEMGSSDGQTEVFELWKDRRPELAEFVHEAIAGGDILSRN